MQVRLLNLGLGWGLCWGLALGLGLGSAAALAAKPDGWPEQPAAHPPWLTNVKHLDRGAFSEFHAESIVNRLKVFWPAPAFTNASVTLYASAGPAGHWPSRDWHAIKMELRHQTWEATVPVEKLDLPLAYFLAVTHTNTVLLSPIRLCVPQDLGVEFPTRAFWSFLEGFEEGLESWISPVGGDFALRINQTEAKTGAGALQISIPKGKRSATAITTRLQGWRIEESGAIGLRLSLRTLGGKAKARFTLTSQAGTPDQVVAVHPKEFAVSETWQTIDLPFDRFPKLSVGAIDRLEIEVIGDGPLELLVDDLELMERWRQP